MKSAPLAHRRLVLRCLSWAGALLLSACTLASTTPLPADSTASAPPRPRLLVFLVVDGLPQRQVLAYRDQLAPDGLARFLDRGAWFEQAHYGHAFTVTGAGHATVLSGAYSHRRTQRSPGRLGRLPSSVRISGRVWPMINSPSRTSMPDSQASCASRWAAWASHWE